MGGSLGEGNTTASAEFNIWADPEAAAIVFESGIPIRMAGLDVTHQALVLPDDVARLEGLGNRAGRVFADLMRFFAIHHRDRYGWDGPPIHDAVAVAWLIDPTLVTSRRLRVDVETGDGLTRGRTVADPEGLTGRPPNAEVGVGDRSRATHGPRRRCRRERAVTAAISPADLGYRPADPGFIADPYPLRGAARGATRSSTTSRPASGSSRGTPTSIASCATGGSGRTYRHVATDARVRADAAARLARAVPRRSTTPGCSTCEPPDHTRLRRLVSKAFTPRTVDGDGATHRGDRRRPRRTRPARGEFDLIADIAEPLPVTVIADLLGVPEADRHLLRPWSHDYCLMFELDPPRRRRDGRSRQPRRSAPTSATSSPSAGSGRGTT